MPFLLFLLLLLCVGFAYFLKFFGILVVFVFAPPWRMRNPLCCIRIETSIYHSSLDFTGLQYVTQARNRRVAKNKSGRETKGEIAFRHPFKLDSLQILAINWDQELITLHHPLVSEFGCDYWLPKLLFLIIGSNYIFFQKFLKSTSIYV